MANRYLDQLSFITVVLGFICASPGECRAAPEATERITFTFDGKTSANGVPSPWQLKVGSGNPEIAVRTDAGQPAMPMLWLRAARASFFLGRTDHHFPPAEYPFLKWSWKALKLPVGGDVRKSSLIPFADNRNDQALQLLVTFENGDTISYMWDTTAPVGTEVKEQNPFSNIKSVVVQSGQDHLGEWISYQRNIVEDYRRLHGKQQPPVVAIAVQTNANHTKSESAGYFSAISVEKHP